MRLELKILAVAVLFWTNNLKGQDKLSIDSTPVLIDTTFETHMCIGKVLAYYRKIYRTNKDKTFELELYDFKNTLIAKGSIVRHKKKKYLPQGEWVFYTNSGKLRKKGNFDKGFKVDIWFDYDSDGKEFYKSYFRIEDKIENEQMMILDYYINSETYFDIKVILTNINY